MKTVIHMPIEVKSGVNTIENVLLYIKRPTESKVLLLLQVGLLIQKMTLFGSK